LPTGDTIGSGVTARDRTGEGRSPLTVEVIRDRASFDDPDGPLARIDWSELDADPDVVLELARARGGEFRPYAIVVRRDEQIVAAATMRIDLVDLAVRVGHRQAYRLRRPGLVAQHGGVFDGGDREGADALVAAIRTALREENLTAAMLPRVRGGSAVLESVHTVSPWLRSHFEQQEIHRRTTIPGSRDEFAAALSRNTRRNISRAEKSLRRRIDQLTVRLYSSEDELDEALAELERVASRTWQRRAGGGFTASPVELALYRAAISRDAFRAWILYDGSLPIAFLHGYAFGGGFSGRYMGYDPAYADCRPGLYLFFQLVRDLCADERIAFYDFGPGDSQFKRSLGDEEWTESDVVLFAAHPGAVLVNVTRSTVSAAAYFAKKAVVRFELLDRAWARRRKGAAAPEQ
jgi:hypothetical protein